MVGGEREEGEKKMERRNDGIERAAEEERRRRGGVSRLTGSPSVLGLPPPSVYRCPAETEGTTELHTPPSPALPALPHTAYSCASVPCNPNWYYTHVCFWPFSCHPKKKIFELWRNCSSKMHTCIQTSRPTRNYPWTLVWKCQKKHNYIQNTSYDYSYLPRF